MTRWLEQIRLFIVTDLSLNLHQHPFITVKTSVVCLLSPQYDYEYDEHGERVVLGKGTFGVVYAGRDLSNQVRLAIKEIPERDSRWASAQMFGGKRSPCPLLLLTLRVSHCRYHRRSISVRTLWNSCDHMHAQLQHFFPHKLRVCLFGSLCEEIWYIYECKPSSNITNMPHQRTSWVSLRSNAGLQITWIL